MDVTFSLAARVVRVKHVTLDYSQSSLEPMVKATGSTHQQRNMIELGLARIQHLLRETPQKWRAIHVAGTNGKGTICANIAAMLGENGYRCARFTSPHLLVPRDSIQVPTASGRRVKVVPEKLYRHVRDRMRKRNRRERIGATEFEVLTATAFHIFNMWNIDMAVVEVGLGGGLDATNVLAQKSVTVISKIGMDHQGFLGDTIQQIAKHKAGIMRPGVPCVLDSTNNADVRSVIEDHARDIGTSVTLSVRGGIMKRPKHLDLKSPQRHHLTADHGFHLADHEWQNFACAYTACRLVHPGMASPWHYLRCIQRSGRLMGRLTWAKLQVPYQAPGRRVRVLLDGAHNEQSAQALGEYVKKIRLAFRSASSTPPHDDTPRPVVWLLAMSNGRDPHQVLRHLIAPGDLVAAVEFGAVPDMPWVKAVPSSELARAATHYLKHGQQAVDYGPNLYTALQRAVELAGNRPLIIAGSLYLVSNILANDQRLLKSFGPTDGRYQRGPRIRKYSYGQHSQHVFDLVE